VAHLVCFASSSENSEHLQSQIQKKTQIVDSCIIKVGSGKHALSGVCEMVKPEPGMHVDFGPEDSQVGRLLNWRSHQTY
jgi:hypothetical protein